METSPYLAASSGLNHPEWLHGNITVLMLIFQVGFQGGFAELQSSSFSRQNSSF